MNANSHSPVGRRARLLHTMLRVRDLDRSIDFYSRLLGMTVLRREEYPKGRFTLVFIGYGNERADTVLELTHNWDGGEYLQGDAFGHIAIAVDDAAAACAALEAEGVTVLRPAGPMTFTATNGARDVIAFIADPDGNRVELIEIAQTDGNAGN